MTKETTTTGPPSTSTTTGSCFLGCFGGSFKNTQPTHNHEVNSSSRRRHWICCFSFKKSPTKTVPVDQSTAHQKSKSVKHDSPTISDTMTEIQLVTEHATWTTKHVKNQKAVKSDEQKTRRKKLKLTAAVKSQNGGVDGGVRTKTQRPAGGEFDFDSRIGMSVILVILFMVVLWGKLFAILCTSAWLFIAPRLVAAGGHSGDKLKLPPESGDNLDLESVEYKKKVVLEGFLQRNYRN
ncbi:hypothetical protein SSX86_032878 [Deinandra increscens subsp. villosa]|uniref:Transmembrane protein n=1 Tax=Deinandra increscens subsp. villosa TaxID=3103831 RepID=A0AAP0C319_9ASTR